MEPAAKSASIKNLLDKISRDVHGITRTQAIISDMCLMCRKSVSTNKVDSPTFVHLATQSDIDEFKISGYCPECFDETTTPRAGEPS